jgi:hypothetical protein
MSRNGWSQSSNAPLVSSGPGVGGPSLDVPEAPANGAKVAARGLVDASAQRFANQEPMPVYGAKPVKWFRSFSGVLTPSDSPLVTTITLPDLPEYWVIRLLATAAGLVNIGQAGGTDFQTFIDSKVAADWFPVPGLDNNLNLYTTTGAANIYYVVFAVRGYDYMNWRRLHGA